MFKKSVKENSIAISKKDRSKYIIIIIVLIVAGWVLSGTLIKSDTNENNAPTKTAKARIPKVRILNSTAQLIDKKITIFGTTQSSKKVILKPEIEGIIEEIVAKEGRLIDKNDTLLTLNIDDRGAKLSQAEASLEQRRIEYKAAKSLSKSGYNPETKKAEAFALLKQAEAEMLSIKLDVGNTNVKSPFAGMLDEIFVEEGDYIKKGETELATILTIDPLLVTGYVPEKVIHFVAVGNDSNVRIITGQEEKGYVSFVSRVADPLTRTFKVEVEIPNANKNIFEGLTSEIEISLDTVKAHLVPPSIFSLSEDGYIGIKTLNKNNKVEFFTVEVIEDTKGGMWVSGLPEKAKIITLGQAFLKRGDTAEATED